MKTVFQNVKKLTHLLSLFRLSSDELMDILNKGRVNPLLKENVFSDSIKLSVLKKIDEIFNKGLSYYVDPSPVLNSKRESIFFRKENFNSSLTLSDIQLVNKYEEKKIFFESILKLSDIANKRIIKKYSILDDPYTVAKEIIELIYPVGNFVNKPKELLKALISNLAGYKILVLEYVEHPQTKYKVSINGFYLSPGVIVLKRQKHIKREIFTLAHEFGHYLLDEEEIDDNIYTESPYQKPSLSIIENWCNNFAFNFLIKDYNIDNLVFASAENDFHNSLINEISQITHLSTLSLYTRLFLNGKLSETAYDSLSKSINEFIQKQQEQEKAVFALNKAKMELKGKEVKIPIVPPIISPLYLQTLQTALSNGVLNEYEFCSTLNIKPEKIDAFLV